MKHKVDIDLREATGATVDRMEQWLIDQGWFEGTDYRVTAKGDRRKLKKYARKSNFALKCKDMRAAMFWNDRGMDAEMTAIVAFKKAERAALFRLMFG